MKLQLSAGLFLLVLAPVALCQTDSIYAFAPDVKITESGEYDGTSFDFFSPRYTAYRGDTVYVIWQEDRNNPPGTWILFARSNDGGKTFGPNVIAAGGVNPAMCVDSAGIINLAYQNSGDIFFRKSTNGGAGFSARVRVTDDTASPSGQDAPSIAVNDKGYIFIAWADQRNISPPNYTTFMSASFDEGMSFTPNIQANEAGTRATGPNVTADDSARVYVGYYGTKNGQSGIVFARSDDSAQSFNFHTLVSDTPWSIGSLSMAISPGGWVGIAWTGTRVVEDSLESILHFSISFDQGETFSSSVRVDDDSDLSTRTAPKTPSLVYRNGIFYVAWLRTDNPFGLDKIFFSFSLDSGQSFVSSVDANVNTTAPTNPWRRMPGLAVNEEGKAFVAWLDGRYIGQIGNTLLLFGAPGQFVQLFKGDLNLDEMLTPTDVVLELNAVFGGQSFPAPFQNADGNCSGDLTPTDMVLLLKAVFQSFPFPCS